MAALRRLRLPLSKIVATIGPASEELPVLPQIVDAGMRIMRVNFSHATEEEVELRMKNLALSPTAAPTTLSGCAAVMLDTAGPEVRTGVLRAMKESGNRRAKVTIEKLARRACVIIDAYGNAAGGAPSWRMSSHYEGTPGHLDAIAPGLRQYGARCARDEADLGGCNVPRWKAPADHGSGGGKGGGDKLGGGVAGGGGGATVEKGKKGKVDVKGQGGAKGTPPGPANA